MSDDDLTTDAIPTPPRDEVEKEDSDEKFEEPENYTQPRSKPKRVFRQHKKNAPTAFASVINISNANGIHIGSNINIYNYKTANKTQKNYIVTDAIQALFNNNTPVERVDLMFLAPHINEEWRNTGRALGYSDGQIDQFYENYIRTGIKEVIYQLLLDWIQTEVDAATVGRLSKVLWETQQEDAVTRWSKKSSK